MEAALATLAASGNERRLAAGEVLVREGAASDSVFLVLTGRVEAVVETSAGRTTVGGGGPGDVLGEIAALAGLPRSATLVAVETSTVVEILATTFRTWLGDRPDVADELVLAARRRLQRLQVTSMAATLLGDDALQLVPHLLELATFVDLPAGALLYAQGDAPDSVAFVLTGHLRAERVVDDVVVVQREIGRSEMVGELAMVQRGPRTATVRAVRDSSLAVFPIDGFEGLLQREPSLGLMLLRQVASRLVQERARVHRARVATVVPLSSVTAAAFETAVRSALHGLGSTLVLDSARVGAAIGGQAAAQASPGELGDVRVGQLLYEAEAEHDHLVLVADREATPWSRRTAQAADTVLYLVDARPTDAERALLRAHLAALPEHTEAARWLVVVDEPGTTRPTSVTSWPERRSCTEVHHVRRGDRTHLERLARLCVGRGIGLVLGGGGARGFAHVGVIRAMRELGIPFDRIGGASMGSLFAAAAARYEDVDELAEVMRMRNHRLFDYTVPVVSLLKAKRVTALIQDEFGGLDVEDLWSPLYCVSTNLTRSRPEVHRRGDLVTAVRASIAIPGVFPPVPVGGDLLVDGGVTDNVPAAVMRADASIGTVIAVDVASNEGPATDEDYGMYLSGWQALRRFAARRRPYPGLGSVLVRTMITSSEGKRASMRIDGTADLYLDIDVPGVGLLEFGKLEQAHDAGHRASMPLLAAWLAARTDTTNGAPWSGAGAGTDTDAMSSA